MQSRAPGATIGHVWVPLRRLSDFAQVPRIAVLRALVSEGLSGPRGNPSLKALDWGYARQSVLVDPVSRRRPARWHTRRCLSLLDSDVAGRDDWDLLVLAEEVEDVLADCLRLEAESNWDALDQLLSTLDSSVAEQVTALLARDGVVHRLSVVEV